MVKFVGTYLLMGLVLIVMTVVASVIAIGKLTKWEDELYFEALSIVAGIPMGKEDVENEERFSWWKKAAVVGILIGMVTWPVSVFQLIERYKEAKVYILDHINKGES